MKKHSNKLNYFLTLLLLGAGILMTSLIFTLKQDESFLHVSAYIKIGFAVVFYIIFVFAFFKKTKSSVIVAGLYRSLIFLIVHLTLSSGVAAVLIIIEKMAFLDAFLATFWYYNPAFFFQVIIVPFISFPLIVSLIYKGRLTKRPSVNFDMKFYNPFAMEEQLAATTGDIVSASEMKDDVDLEVESQDISEVEKLDDEGDDDMELPDELEVLDEESDEFESDEFAETDTLEQEFEENLFDDEREEPPVSKAKGKTAAEEAEKGQGEGEELTGEQLELEEESESEKEPPMFAVEEDEYADVDALEEPESMGDLVEKKVEAELEEMEIEDEFEEAVFDTEDEALPLEDEEEELASTEWEQDASMAGEEAVEEDMAASIGDVKLDLKGDDVDESEEQKASRELITSEDGIAKVDYQSIIENNEGNDAAEQMRKLVRRGADFSIDIPAKDILPKLKEGKLKFSVEYLYVKIPFELVNFLAPGQSGNLSELYLEIPMNEVLSQFSNDLLKKYIPKDKAELFSDYVSPEEIELNLSDIRADSESRQEEAVFEVSGKDKNTDQDENTGVEAAINLDDDDDNDESDTIIGAEDEPEEVTVDFESQLEDLEFATMSNDDFNTIPDIFSKFGNFEIELLRWQRNIFVYVFPEDFDFPKDAKLTLFKTMLYKYYPAWPEFDNQLRALCKGLYIFSHVFKQEDLNIFFNMALPWDKKTALINPLIEEAVKVTREKLGALELAIDSDTDDLKLLDLKQLVLNKGGEELDKASSHLARLGKFGSAHFYLSSGIPLYVFAPESRALDDASHSAVGIFSRMHELRNKFNIAECERIILRSSNYFSYFSDITDGSDNFLLYLEMDKVPKLGALLFSVKKLMKEIKRS